MKELRYLTVLVIRGTCVHLVRSWSPTSFEPDSVIEFGFYCFFSKPLLENLEFVSQPEQCSINQTSDCTRHAYKTIVVILVHSTSCENVQALVVKSVFSLTRAVQPVATCRQSPHIHKPATVIVTSFATELATSSVTDVRTDTFTAFNI